MERIASRGWTRARRALVFVVCLLTAAPTPASSQDVPDLETLDGPTAIKLMEEGKLTSVKLVKAYIKRIEALNKRGPGLNAVTQLNPTVLEEAAQLDKERAQGLVRGPAHGLPVLLKDLIDVKGMYTSAGNWSLRDSFPETDSGVAKKLRENGVLILGKHGLSEFAFFFGSGPSGFSNLTGQVINALDADQNPGGSSSGTGSAGAAALSLLAIGTSTGGSITSPSGAAGIFGLTPTLGLVPGYGIAPIAASQDTAGPMERSMADIALNLASTAGPDPLNDYTGIWGPGVDDDYIVLPLPDPIPDYLSALDLDYVQGKRIGYTNTTPQTLQAIEILEAAGAILVSRPNISAGTTPPSVFTYEAARDVTRYYQRLGPLAPIQSLHEEILDNEANPHEALKFGNVQHKGSDAIDLDPNSADSVTYRQNLVLGKQITRAGLDRMFQNDTPDDPSDDFIALLGAPPNPTRPGYPWLTMPMGYAAETRRAINTQLVAPPYMERDLIGIGYVIEQGMIARGTPPRLPVSAVNPSMYRCAKTVPPPPYSKRGSCNPDYDSLADKVRTAPELDFSLETESVQSLQARMAAGTLTSFQLTKAYLARIALTNAEGPATQAVRMVLPDRALNEARRMDNARRRGQVRGPLHGIPVLLADVIDAKKMPTTGGSIALQFAMPRRDAKLVEKLRDAGAIILGKANVTELNGVFDANLPEGYSSLGGQVLVASDTDKTPAGSSGGAAAATATGLAGLTIGLETSTDTAQIVAPAGVAGVVGLKPTVGLVSRTGVLPVAKTQDSPGPITRTVFDAAAALQAIAGPDPADDATSAAPAVPDYLTGLVPTALAGKRVAVIASTTAPYPTVVSAIEALGATVVTTTIGTPSPNPASIVMTELERDLDAYLASVRPSAKGVARSLQAIIDYNAANPIEGLKYQQRELTAAAAIDLADPATLAAYESDKSSGLAANRALIDAILSNGTADPSDDVEVVVVPSGNALVGIADRAGYPVLTVPAGFGTGNAGRNPIGVTFVAGPFAEAKLLAAGYAFEQATNVRLAPSYTNPSMWRCVPGSTFFSPHHCHPGDRQAG